jgi:hypothetical protein
MRTNLVHLPLLACLVVLTCADQVRARVPTGVTVQKLEAGGTEFLATARASEQAIASGSFARKQTTACEAAKLLLEREFESRGLGRPDYTKSGSEFFLLQEAEYCRIRLIR